MNTNTGTGPLGGGIGGRRHHGVGAGATTGYDGYGEPGLAGNAPVGTGPGVTGRRGPVRAVEDAIAGTGPGVGTTGGGLTGGLTGGRRNAGLGTGAGVGAGTGAGVGAGTGAGLGGAGIAATTTGLGAGGVRPPMGQRVAGEAEKLAGQVLGNPAMVARGQEKKTGMPAGGGVGGVGTGGYY